MFQLDPISRIPLYEQILSQMERFILTGVLQPGDQIPSVRSVSTGHSVNPRTVLKAYTELDARGLIASAPGKGYFICENALEKLKQEKRGRLEELDTILEDLAVSGIEKQDVLDCVNKHFE